MNMIFPIDGFVGRADGEDLFYEKMKEILPNNYVSFHNQGIGMEEADVILLIPNRGIVVVEIKSDRPHNVNKARDNNFILKKNGDVIFSPFKQAARYRNSLIDKLKNTYVEYKKYVIAHAPCFPFFTKEDLRRKEMGKICNEELFITKEDMVDFDAFTKRINVIFECANKIDIPGMKYNQFSIDDLINVGNIILPNCLAVGDFQEDENKDINVDANSDYSHIYVRGEFEDESDEICENIINQWKRGTKIYYFSNSLSSVNKLNKRMTEIISQYQIKSYEKKYDELNIAKMNEAYGFFNFTIEHASNITESFEVVNGIVDEEKKKKIEKLGKIVHFNVEQFLAEHAPTENMLVNAGAGTGKTYLLVSRIAYLIWKNKYNAGDLKKKIALITFTNDATEEMRARLESYFSKMFLVTFNKNFYEYIEIVENMIISTIDSFGKRILSKFSYNLGNGTDLSVTSATLIKQMCVRNSINDYLKNEKKSSELAISSFEMQKLLLELISNIENRNKDPKKMQELFNISFAKQANSILDYNTASNYELVQKDLAAMFLRVPQIMLEIEEEANNNNQMLIGQIIISLGRVVDLIRKGRIEKPIDVDLEYVFIDEFQDTDDQQITLVSEFQKLFDFKLFVVGDVKQSIYRFRGANDDRAFVYLKELCEKEFLEFDLVKNYRTNTKLLNYFDKVFKNLSNKKGYRKSKGLLAYNERDVLEGVNNPDYPAQIQHYCFVTDAEREKLICNIIKSHTPEMGTMAILVRNNYQVADIRRICRENEIYNVDIDTGGTLYQQEATIDLFKLAYALQNVQDASALFNLYTTAYVNDSLDKNELYDAVNKEKYFNSHLPSSLSKWKYYVDRLQTEPILRVIREIIDDVCPWNIYAQRLRGTDDEKEVASLRYKNNLDKLFEKIAIETNGLYLTLNSLVDSLRIMITTSQEEEERPISKSFEIQCRTVHRAKGKEYDYVFLPYADDTFEKAKPKYNKSFIIGEEGIGYFIPIDGVEYKNDIFEQEDQKEREEQSYEEARIFYVALTRAKIGIIFLETIKRNKFQTSWFEILKEK